MIGRIAWNAGRWQIRQVQKSAAQKGGPWTPLAVVFTVAAMLAVWPVANLALSGHLLAALVLVAVPSLALGVMLAVSQNRGTPSSSAVLDKYQDRPAPDSPERLRERAELLDDTEAVNRAVAAKFAPSAPHLTPGRLLGARHDTPDMTGPVLDWEPVPEAGPAPQASAALHIPPVRQREDELTAAVFAVPCPEETCLAAAGVPCVMGLGIPVALVDLKRVKFAHVARITAAVTAGLVTAGEVMARFRAGEAKGVVT